VVDANERMRRNAVLSYCFFWCDMAARGVGRGSTATDGSDAILGRCFGESFVVVLTAARGTGGGVCKAAVVYKAGQGLQTMASLAEDTTSGGSSWRERLGGEAVETKRATERGWSWSTDGTRD
jgi:hypothetical protein